MHLSICAEKVTLAVFNKMLFRKPHLRQNNLRLVTMQWYKHLPTNVVFLHLH